jgi:molybdopterin converting factor subunit 1
MQVRVRLFARARDLAGRDAVVLEVPGGATAGDLRRRLADEHPALRGLLQRSALAVNSEFAEDDLTLPLDAEIALLPPVSGGQRTERA